MEQWIEWKVFDEHTGHVSARVCDASTGLSPTSRPWRAVFCNYVLDVLPFAIVRRTEHGWEQLCVRAWLPNDAALLRQYTTLTVSEIRAHAGSDDAERKRQILPLIPLLELERAAHEQRLFASVASVSEIALKAERGELLVGADLHAWIAEQQSPPGVRLLSIIAPLAIDSTTLRRRNAVLVTCDELILDYADEGHVTPLDARP